MCGRFALTSSTAEIIKEFDIEGPSTPFSPSYNIAPSLDILAVINDGANRLALFHWGLIPHWAKDEKIGHRMINARAESLSEKPSFRTALKKRRCLVVADGFYEWKHAGKKKTPYYVRLKNHRPFGLAGLYDEWKSPEGEVIDSCTIITTDSNALIERIHDRMPVIVPKDMREMWLDPANRDSEQVLKALKAYSSKDMEIYQVSTIVNSPANDSPECIKPV